MFKQHTDKIILIPQHISRIALFSVQFVLFVCYLAYIYEYTRLCILLFGLYVSSILHWNKVQHKGIVKTIDIILANSVFMHVTIFDCNRFIHKYIWYITAVISVSGFITNEYLFYHQVLTPLRIYPKGAHGNFTLLNRPIMGDLIVQRCKNKKVGFISKYWYFSLDYTNPNTMNRELAYYRSTFTHMFFIHVLPTTVCAYLGVSSYIKK